MNVSRILALVATVLFAVAFVLVLTASGNQKLALEMVYLGLACFAGAHCIP